MRKRVIYLSLFGGIISGVIIGMIYKVVERMTGVKVYTLLLNIDFIPFLGHINFPEFVEFLFHLIVSVILTFVLYAIAAYFSWTGKKSIIMLAGLSVIVGIFIYPITNFSMRTPDLFSLVAILWWMVGHLIYGLTLSWVYHLCSRQRSI